MRPSGERLPEHSLGRDGERALARILAATSRPGTFSEADLAEYRRSWAGPKALRGMPDWYRAALRHPPARMRDARIAVPTLLIWGARDRFLGSEMARPSFELCDDARLVVIESATHWLQHEEPDRVNALIDGFVRGGGSGNEWKTVWRPVPHPEVLSVKCSQANRANPAR